mmetsp:Transcript_38/g.63  ORF Transcript_38/g.63 Transcript_38/m.63 type:complete len:265 (+) Transcript_38:105-899(+)
MVQVSESHCADADPPGLSCSLGRRRLLGCLRVKVGAGDGDARAHHGLCGHDLVEEQHRREDDRNALDDVAHAMRHGAHALQRVERKLVVQVVQQADHEEVAPELLRSDLGNGRFRTRLESASLHDQGQRRADDDRHQRGVGVHGCRAQSLGHGHLRPHGAEAKRQVGEHGSAEAHPVKAQLTSRRQAHTDHDWDQGEHSWQGSRLAQDQLRQHDIESRLQRLDGVRERNRDGSKRQVGRDMANGVHRCWAENSTELLLRDDPAE